MKRTMKAVCASLALLLTSAAYGFDWNSVSGGSVTIFEPVTVTSDEDAAKMAAIESIVIAEGGSITCQGLTTALTIPVDFSGPGTFTATGCAQITLTGDNSQFLGGFSFSSTPLVVGSRYGLGGPGTATCNFHYGDAGVLFDFNYADAVMTNDVPILVSVVEGKNNSYFGPTDTGKKLVLLGGWEMVQGGGNYYIYFRGKMVFDGGTFGARAGYLYTGYSSHKPEVWFMPGTTLSIGGKYWFALGNETYHFNCGFENFIYYAPNTPVNTICEKENAFPANLILSMYNVRSDSNAGFDLNGFDQTIGRIQNQQGVEAGKFANIWSEEEATLTLSDAAVANYPADYKISGKVNLHQTGNITQVFTNVLSTSVGSLTVSSGGVSFTYGSGWSGTNVVVEGGVLTLDSPTALSNARHELRVSGTGKLKVTSAVLNTGAHLAIAQFGDVVLENDRTYTIAELKAMKGVSAYIDESSDDTAVIKIAPKIVAWPGWPEDGGEVVVSTGTAVEITDDDVEKVALVTKITLLPDSSITCKNATKPLVLQAQVTGTGTIYLNSPAGVTLAGDSSGLDDPGSYIAKDTVVTVTHRYGLGDSGTAKFQSLGGDIVFKGNGLTNDVAIYYSGAGHRLFGPREGRGPWVQSGDFIAENSDASHHTQFTNDVIFTGSCRYGAMGHGVMFYRLARHTNFTAEPGTTMYYASAIGGGLSFYMLADAQEWSTYNIGSVAPPGTKFGTLHPGVNIIWFNCGAEDMFANLVTGIYPYGSPTPVGGIDLCGYDQHVKIIRLQDEVGNAQGLGYYRVTTEKYHAVIHTDTPATLTITKPMEGEFLTGLRFTGAANFTYAAENDDPYSLYWQKSTSTGALTVESGVLRFESGNSWGGTNVFLKGGSLEVAADSEPPFTAVPELFVSGEGSLELGANVEATVFRCKVGDEYLSRGEYTASSGLSWLKGGGKLIVRRNSPTLGMYIVVE